MDVITDSPGLVAFGLLALIYLGLCVWAHRRAKARKIPEWVQKMDPSTRRYEALDLIPWIRGLLTKRPKQTRLSRYLLGFLTVFVGIYISADAAPVGGTGIVDGLLNALVRLEWQYGVDWSTLGFMLSWTYLAWLLNYRLSGEDDEATDKEARRRELVAAIYHAPNMDVLTGYPATHRRVFDALRLDAPPSGTPKEVADEWAGRIVIALAAVAKMVQTFGRHPEDAYGANVMVYLTAEQYAKFGSPIISFPTPGMTPTEAIGLLVLPEELILPDLTHPARRTVPSIALAVHDPIHTEIGSFQTLPGAPTALLSPQGFSVEHDTRTMATRYGYVPDSQIAEYFSDSGDGHDVRSFAALKIQQLDPENPAKPLVVGVLNVDTNVPRILGSSPTDRDDDDDPLYTDAFVALLRPLGDLLAPAVAAYITARGMSGSLPEPPDAV